MRVGQVLPLVALSLVGGFACGKTTGETRGYGAGDGGRGGGMDGGASEGGAAAGSSSAGDGQGQPGGGSVIGGAGTSTGVGGAAGAGSGATTGSGASTGSGATTGSGGAGSQVDPYADARRQTVTDYCALLDVYPCLSYSAQRGTVTTTRAEMMQACQQDLEVQQSSIWGDVCFDEWRSVLECLTDAPWTCPCSGNDCMLASPGGSPGPLNGVCDPQAAALSACLTTTNNSGVATGAAGDCNYLQSDVDGCYVQCFHDVGIFESHCEGPVGGAQSCWCILNGVNLRDPANESGWFWADDCTGVAQTMADGYCEQILDCCFTWVSDGVPQCTCTSDPTAGGFDSCQAAATAGGGEVVDLCPQYQIAWAQFPQTVDGGGG